jgi:hypothetical protein
MTLPQNERRMRWEMFALSFTALFLEMMVIRWVPSVVHLVAYYANLMLLSSFLGLGAGAMAAGRRWKLFGWFPVFLALDIGMLLLDRNTVLGTSAGEAHFFSLPPSMFHAFALIRIFAVNALLFVPLGQRMGLLFNALPRLTAYAWDLAGSLFGTLCFGLFSLKLFSPVLGMAGVMLVYLWLSGGRRWWINTAVFAAALAAVVWFGNSKAIWSPYYYITVNRDETPTVTETTPPADLRTMRDPPVYFVRVNQFAYHLDAALDPRRYTPGTELSKKVKWMERQYGLPYLVAAGRDRMLVVGAGGGCDVESALEAGARHVDAVEIDQTVIDLSRKFNAEAPYSDPRVSVQIDDARAFLARATPGYDMVIFGFLDSQALFSTMNNVRLDGYVYTMESMRSAFRLLGDHGMLTLSFYVGRPWLGLKLYRLVREATGREPVIYFGDGEEHAMILCVPRDAGAVLPNKLPDFHRGTYVDMPRIDLPTDDWPFLYLVGKTIPSDYLIAIASLLVFSVSAVAWLRRGSFGRGDVHFGLLGMGFLLLETKNISDCTLFFGATWFVTLLVVTGVLLMVIAANLVSERLRGFSLWMYAPLLATLALLLFVPRESVLDLPYSGRMLWALLVVPLPIFFAGIIFSTTFREAASPSAVFGANLIGAMLGGFCEYLAMAVGNHRLSILVIVAYLGSMLVVASSRRMGRAI